MDEYFCPNCGATLNDQFGFDPSCGTWTCTSCGKLLMDDDVYEGDTFEGVAWFCDGCGALLNRQSGFTDSNGSWTCTECGHHNGTTEDDIVDDSFSCPKCGSTLNSQWGFNKFNDDHECSSCGAKLHHSHSDDEYSIVEDDSLKCPNCGAKLNDQLFFADYNYDWECTECGAHLHHSYSSDPYTVVEEDKGPQCPQCGAYLKDQSCFSDFKDDWECKECGAHLHHSYSSDPYTVVEEDKGPQCPQCGAYLKDQSCFSEYEDDWECTECGTHLHHDYSSDPYEVVGDDDDEDGDDDDNYSDHSSDSSYTPPSYTPPMSSSPAPPRLKKEKKLPDSDLRKQRIKAFLFKRKKIQIKLSYVDLLGRNVDDVETLLLNQAFVNIIKVPIKDIYVGSPYYVGQVEQVAIQGNSYFNKGDLIPYDAEIVVTYHVKREIIIPFSERSLRKLNYIVAGDKLQDLGFTEIYERPIRDLVTGWVTKDGSVEKVTIGDTYPFKKNSVFTYDTRITIEYHTFKKK